MINPTFKRQLEIVGIVVKQHFADSDPYHIKNVHQELQTNGCFQKDCDFYKKGNKSAFKITYEQATQFLEDDCQNQETIMPREKETAAAIFPCGVEATMHKRFNSLKESLKKGYSYDKIHFLVKDTDKKMVMELIETTYKDSLEGIEAIFLVDNTDLNNFESCLTRLKESNELPEKYIIITDPTFAPKVEMMAAAILDNHFCLGIASAPIKDWREDLKLYGYDKAIPDPKQAVIARACALWNFKAREADAQLKIFNSKATKL